MWELVLKWLVPFLCGGAVTFATTMFIRLQAIKNGLQCLLRSELIRSYEKYSDHGYCELYAKEALTKAYKAYHSLGGNDVATDLYHNVMDLPTEKEFQNGRRKKNEKLESMD